MVRMSKKLYVGALVATFALLFLCGIPVLFLLNSYAIPRGLGIHDDYLMCDSFFAACFQRLTDAILTN